MYRIAVVGDYDSIYGFAALGLTTFPVRAGGYQPLGEEDHRKVQQQDR